MLYRHKQGFYFCALLCTYFLLFHFLIQQKLNNDFSSFYSAALAYLHHASPYHQLASDFLIKPQSLAINVNPPFFVWLISPLTYLSYTQASLIWCISSLLLGLWGGLLCFYLGSEANFFKRNWPNFILIYLASYACLMNTNFNQIAGFLLFFIMTGYYFFLKKKDYSCGLFWGLAIALKLFPGLFFIFALVEKRYKVFWTMLIVFLLTWSLPLVTRGSEIYLQYFANLGEIIWYGNSWNASILAYLFRIFVDMNQSNNILLIKVIYYICFVVLFVYYVKKLTQLKTHYGFCLSLMMMLLLSPFGWMYYFALLLPTLIVIYQNYQQEEESIKNILSWSLCLILLNLPLGNVQARDLSSLFAKLTLGSIYFYGLVMTLYLLFYIVQTSPQPPSLNSQRKTVYLSVLEVVLTFGVFIVLSTLIQHIRS